MFHSNEFTNKLSLEIILIRNHTMFMVQVHKKILNMQQATFNHFKLRFITQYFPISVRKENIKGLNDNAESGGRINSIQYLFPIHDVPKRLPAFLIGITEDIISLEI